jgi:hypothetical protein
VELDDPLPSRASFLSKRAEDERAQGVTWSTNFPPNIRNRLRDALILSIGPGLNRAAVFTNELRSILESHSQHSHTLVSADTAFQFARNSDVLVDVLDATALALRQLASSHNGEKVNFRFTEVYDFRHDEFIAAANDILLEGRIAYTFIDGRLRPRGSEPLHTDVIEPVEAALTSDGKFAQAEAAYQDALTSMAGGHYGASITSSGSALQQTFVALGAQGQNLGALVADARSRGFLMAHDEKLVTAYKNIADWITADRSNRGTAHSADSSTRADAELAIHVVAALIIRLVG